MQCRILRQQDGSISIIFGFFLAFVMIPVLALCVDIGGGFFMSAGMQNAASASSIASAMEDADAGEAEEYFAANLPAGQYSIEYDFGSDVEVARNDDSTVSVIPRHFRRPGFFSPAIQPKGVSTIKASSISIASLPQGAIVPTNFAFVLDKSGSMGPGFGFTSSPLPGGGNVPKIIAAAQAFDLIMQKVKAANRAAEHYSVAVSAFSSSVEPRDKFDFTNDFDQATADVYDIMQPELSTCGACGLFEIRNFLPNAPGKDRKLLVIWMTDGSQNIPSSQACTARNRLYTSYIPPNPLPGGLPVFDPQPSCSSRKEYMTTESLTAAAAECALIKSSFANVEIWTIGFGQTSESEENSELLDFCATTPQQHLHAQTGADLGKIFDQILTQAMGVRIRR